MDVTGLDADDAALAQARDFPYPCCLLMKLEKPLFASQAQADGFGILRGGRFLHLIGETDKGQSQQILKQLYEKTGRSHMTWLHSATARTMSKCSRQRISLCW